MIMILIPSNSLGIAVKSLLKVTRQAHLGLLLVSELARHRLDAGLVSLEEVARKTGSSRKFLEQIASELRLAKIIEGVRGAAGGYRLVRDPAALSVVEVMNAVEGPMSLEACTAHQVKGQMSKVKSIIEKVQGQVMATLMNTTISDLI